MIRASKKLHSLALESIAILRLPTTICLFMYGKRFWGWVKRLPCCGCLNVVEYEQRVEFDIFNAKDYVVKVNANVL